MRSKAAAPHDWSKEQQVAAFKGATRIATRERTAAACGRTAALASLAQRCSSRVRRRNNRRGRRKGFALNHHKCYVRPLRLLVALWPTRLQ